MQLKNSDKKVKFYTQKNLIARELKSKILKGKERNEMKIKTFFAAQLSAMS
jgi:hypothetical protein